MDSPRYGTPLTELLPTSTESTLGGTHLHDVLHRLLDGLGFPPGLDLHSFRRSYATHLITAERFDVSFVQMQLGHEHASTTSIYSIPSPDYQRLTLERVHNRTLDAARALPPRKRNP